MLVIDNSGSMAEEGKCEQVTDAVQNLVMTMQSQNLGASRSRQLMNICSFGDDVREMALAAQPNEIDLDRLVFLGDQGGTNLHLALQWAKGALQKSLDRARNVPHYQEERSPDPLCVVLSDGEITGPDCKPYVQDLHTVPIEKGKVNIVAVGVGMQEQHFQVLKEIASTPENAVQIGSKEIAEFLAEMGDTMVGSLKVEDVVAKRR
jgi:uncharacterized protein YegL